MADGICFAGLDVHARTVAAAAVMLGSGEVFRAQLGPAPEEAIGWLRSLPGEVRAVYEAGPTGFGLARQARAAGLELMVCSPGSIPRQPGDRVKTDRRDALKLARLHAAGQLRAVLVPEPPLEALRDLVRAREDLRGDLMATRHRVSKMLLRRGLVWSGPGETWSRRHLEWLSRARFDEPLAEVVFGEYLACHEVLLARRDRLDRLIAEQAEQDRWAALVGRLRCLRGIDTLSALGLVTEIGDFARFKTAEEFMAFVGLVPSEHSSGERRRQGSITKVGNSHVRRLLVESAWHARRRPTVGYELARRQRGQNPAVLERGWRCQQRLYQRWQRMAGRGKPQQKIVVACARELAGFVWAIATDQPLRSL